jgi:bacterioferritin-associated ferredoxin
MYVCICHALTKDQLLSNDGPSLVRRRARGRGCGGCASRIRKLLSGQRRAESVDSVGHGAEEDGRIKAWADVDVPDPLIGRA